MKSESEEMEEQFKNAFGGVKNEDAQDTPYVVENGLFSESSATFFAALHEMRTKQMEASLSGDKVNHRTVLRPTAQTGSTDTCDTVLAALKEELTRDKEPTRESLSLAAATTPGGDIEFFNGILACLKRHLTCEQAQEFLTAENTIGESFLLAATRAGDIDFFRDAVTCLRKQLTSQQVRELLMAKNKMGETLLLEASLPGDIDFFKSVLACLKEHLTSEQVDEMVMAKNAQGHHLPVASARTGNSHFFGALCSHLAENDTLEKVQGMLMSKDVHGQIDFSAAVQNCGGSCFTATIGAATRLLSSEQVRELILSKSIGKTLLRVALERKDVVSLEAFLQCLKDAKPWEGNQMADELDLHGTFSACAEVSLALGGDLRHVELGIISYLLQNYARSSPDDLIKLARRERRASDGYFKACCMRAVTFAANPFIPGMSLSVTLAEAAERAPEGEKGFLITLQKKVDKLLLEILERLPPTVRAFHGGMDGCCSVFEPELTSSTEAPPGTAAVVGILSATLKVRQQRETYCKVPLVMDFLSCRFTRGLPNVRDTSGVLSDSNELQGLLKGSAGVDNDLLVDELLTFTEAGASGSENSSDPERKTHFLYGRNSMLASFLSPRALLQGAHCEFPSLTILPGVQFVVAGLVAKPGSYHRVPAMRMMLDFVVFVGMLAVFTFAVLFHEDGPLTWSDLLVAGFIAAAFLREVGEVRKDSSMYFDDRWNMFDVPGLVILAVGLLCRVVDSSSRWGHALYALSAPLFFARILFFAQILRFQGPMIEVIFSMTAELVKFGIVMAVVVVGYAVSFHALFRDSDSFGETLLDLFKAMLGEVGFFDAFSGSHDDPVATILLVVYLVIITIMLLNLLVAILSTSYAKVQEDVEGEFRISKARMIQYYQLVVDTHLLPAPFNLIQLAASTPFRLLDRVYGGQQTYHRAKEDVGRLVFWLVLGPLAVVGGALLWMASALTFTRVWRKHYSKQMAALML